ARRSSEKIRRGPPTRVLPKSRPHRRHARQGRQPRLGGKHPRQTPGAARFTVLICPTFFHSTSEYAMSSILQEIETEIAGLKTSVTKTNVGVVREIGDGAAKVEGLSDVMLNEMVEFPGGLFGL